MSFTVHPNWRVLTVGDSISDPNFEFQWWRYVQFKSDSFYAGKLAPPLVPPIYIPEGVNGSQFSNIAARLAAELTKWAPHAAIFFAGVNNANNAIAIAPTGTNDFTTCMNLLSGIPVLLIDILCIGEKWSPAGSANPNDNTTNGINNYVAMMATVLAGFPNVTYQPVRPSWLAFETANNLPSPGTSSGPLTKADAAFIHPNPRGIKFLGDLAFGNMVLALT